MSDPVKNFKNNRRKKINPYDFYYHKGYNGDNSNGETSELIQAKDQNNRNIGDRNVYRFINPVSGDTTIVAFPQGEFVGLYSTPIKIYDNTAPNWNNLNALFDAIKNSRKLDNYGTYYEDSKYFK